jgi:hypothetical protein
MINICIAITNNVRPPPPDVTQHQFVDRLPLDSSNVIVVPPIRTTSIPLPPSPVSTSDPDVVYQNAIRTPTNNYANAGIRVYFSLYLIVFFVVLQ